MAIYSLLFGHTDWPDHDLRAHRQVHAPPLDDTARVTLRLPAGLKRRVEASARLEGLNAETWVAGVLARSVDPRMETL